MSKLKNFFKSPKIVGKCSKLHFFSSKTSMKCAIISVTKCVSNNSKLVNLFGKRHSVSEKLFKWLQIGKGSFVTFDTANWEAIGNKHGVSNSVFEVTRIIE